jgi:hypothetical protein
MTGKLVILGTVLAAVAVRAPQCLATEGGDSGGIEFFEARIRPVLSNNCYECHSAKATKVRGGLLLDSRDGLLKGGDAGPVVIPGNPDGSRLIQAQKHEGLKMPPREKLSEAVIADFIHWVKIGAPDPRTNVARAAPPARALWSLKPVGRPAVHPGPT